MDLQTLAKNLYGEDYSLWQLGSLRRQLQKKKITEVDITWREEENGFGAWDMIHGIPLSCNTYWHSYACTSCGKKIIDIDRNHKRRANPTLCGHCSKSKTLTEVNRNSNKVKNAEIFADPLLGSIRKEKLRENRIRINQTVMADFIRNLSPERKEQIAIQKKQTWGARPVEEKKEINKTRNGYLYKSEKEIQERVQRGVETKKKNLAKLSSEEIRQKTLERVAKMKATIRSKPKDLRFNHPERRYVKGKQGEVGGVYFQSSYEEAVLQFCCMKMYKIQRGPALEYYNPIGKSISLYFVDFLINDTLLVEIKSNYTWDQNIEINKAKERCAQSYAQEQGLTYLTLILSKEDIKDVNKILENTFNKEFREN